MFESVNMVKSAWQYFFKFLYVFLRNWLIKSQYWPQMSGSRLRADFEEVNQMTPKWPSAEIVVYFALSARFEKC